MSDWFDRQAVWRLAQELRAAEPAGEHVDLELLDRYARDAVTDPALVRDLRYHIARCESCLRRLGQFESQAAEAAEVSLPLIALRRLGSMWLGGEPALHARVASPAEKRLESTERNGVRLDARVTPADQLTVTVTQGGVACAGWVVTLEQVADDMSTERALATTDENGRADLGPAIWSAPTGASFRLVARPQIG